MKKADVANLVGIYTVLLGLSYCFYLIIVIVKGNDAVSSALLSWSATMFATIALLYTFNSWRDQKGSEVLSKLSEQSFYDLINLEKLHDNFYEKYTNEINTQRFNDRIFNISNIYINEIQIFDQNMEKLLNTLVLIQEKSKNNKINDCIIDVKNLNYDIKLLISNLSNSYIKNINIDDLFLDNHIDKMKGLSFKLKLNIVLIRGQLIKYIFHEEDKSA